MESWWSGGISRDLAKPPLGGGAVWQHTGNAEILQVCKLTLLICLFNALLSVKRLSCFSHLKASSAKWCAALPVCIGHLLQLHFKNASP